MNEKEKRKKALTKQKHLIVENYNYNYIIKYNKSDSNTSKLKYA